MKKQKMMQCALTLAFILGGISAYAQEVYRCDDFGSGDHFSVMNQDQGGLVGVYDFSIMDSHSRHDLKLNCNQQSFQDPTGLKFMCEGGDDYSQWTANLYEDRVEIYLKGSFEPRVLNCSIR